MEDFKQVHNDIMVKLKENDSLYTVRFFIEDSSLVIDITEDEAAPAINYSSKFSISDLQTKSNYFKIFDSIELVIPDMKKMGKENRMKIKKVQNLIKLTLSTNLEAIKEIELNIPQAEMDPNRVIADLCEKINELNKELKLLKNMHISEEQLQNNLKSKDIFLDKKEKKMIYEWILKSTNNEGKRVQPELLYKLKSQGSFSASQFHSSCDNNGPTLTVVRTDKGYRFGGFTSQSWTSNSSGSSVNDPTAFLFSLEYKEHYPISDSTNGNNAIYNYYTYGPTFGSTNDICIADNCSKNYSSYTNFPYYYGGKSCFCRGLTGGYYNFKVDELEVYKIAFS
jgi:hypothetical protein